MTSKDIQRQAEIFQAMQMPDFYPHPVTFIEHRETHISKVFLTGAYVYKIKKPVNLDFLDFTTLKKRQYFCQQEVALNRRLTHDVYLDVVPITLQNGSYYLSGPGSPVEYAVKMRQLPKEASMIRILRKGKIDREATEKLASFLARFYSQTNSNDHISTFGSWETVRTNCEENFRQTEPFIGMIIEKQMFQIIRAVTRSFLHRRRKLFLYRLEQQKIRDCHGDLRAGHIYITDRIQIIDCIEFNERFRYGDIASDLAFLAMDLDHEGYTEIAQHLIEAYVRQTEDYDLFVLLDFYKCYRAFIRVKVNCFRLQGSDLSKEEREDIIRETHQYMHLAYRYAMGFTRPVIWIICGMPASGKTTIAGELAKTLCVEVFNSDVIRKKLFGLQISDQTDIPFQEGIYSKGAGSLTYGKLLLATQEEIKRGNSVILDATFGKRNHRKEVMRLAKDMYTNLLFVECVCSETLLKKRLRMREKQFSISDARLYHLEKIRKEFDPLDELCDDMHIVIDTKNSLKENIRQILSQDYSLLSRQTNATIPFQ